MSNAKYIYKKFKGKIVNIYSGLDAEWITYQEITTYNHYIIVGKVSDYDEENDILELTNEDGQKFYIGPDQIGMFWLNDKNFNIMNSLKKTVNSGTPYFATQAEKDAKFEQHIKNLKKSKLE